VFTREEFGKRMQGCGLGSKTVQKSITKK